MLNNIIEKAINFRTLGQNLYSDHKLYRSGDLTHINCDLAEYIYSALGIRTFVDLRSREEVRRYGKPSKLIDVGIKWVNSPIEDYPNNSIADLVPAPQSYARYYFDILRCCGNQLSNALEQIILHANEPLVFGCYAGKDRTGLIAICLMEIAGASPEQIKADYAESTDKLHRHKAHFRDKWLKRNIDSETYMRRITAHPETIDFLYELLRGESVITYLVNFGLESCILKKLRQLS